MALRILKDLMFAIAPPLRRARDHIHHQNRLIEAARQDAAAALAERDAARKRVADLEAELERRSTPPPPDPPQALLEEMENLRREVERLETAHRTSVDLNTELLAELPRLPRSG